MEWMDFTSLAEIVVILLEAFGLIISFIAGKVDKWPRRLCIALLSSSIAVGLFNLLEKTALFYHAPIPVCYLFTVITTLITPIPSLLVLAYFIYACGENYRKNLALRLQCILVIILIIAEFTGDITGQRTITPEYEVQIGSWRLFYLVIILLLFLIGLIALFRRWKKPALWKWFVFLLCFILPSYLQGILVELLLMIDLVQSYRAQQEEAALQRTHVAILQMRPHFIHNTLMSIYYLCEEDPKKAQEVIRDFNRYLQSNFTAIGTEGTIPFTEELEHTKAYLAVEQTRYQGRLLVEFNTPDLFFRIPPLTLQPVVENAIRHGLDPNRGPLSVSIRTEATPQGVNVIVEDTGPGFTPADSNEPHFALDNIRERLRTMCNGTLTITLRETGGTRVVMFIPLS